MSIYALGHATPLIHHTAFVNPDATVIGSVEIGADASIGPGAVLRGDYGPISVGARTSVQDGTVIHVARGGPTVIGAHCVSGPNAHLEAYVVEASCLVGFSSIILNRVRVGAGAVIGAGAIVPKGAEVPAGSLALGIPARMRPLSVGAFSTADGVRDYLDNARRYQRELRRIG